MTYIPKTIAFKHLYDIYDTFAICERNFLKTIHGLDRPE